MKKITVLFGNYGSGKTELSLNMALAAKKIYDDVTLVDLDIVNPYFRSSEHKKMLEKQGIHVVSPVYANTSVDVPSLPPQVYTAFQGTHAFFDCGGDSVGATALGSLKSHFDKNRQDVLMLFVINTMRPFQQSADEIYDSLTRIEHSARLKADGFVLNSNLGRETTGHELAEGYRLIKPLTKKTGLAVKFVCGTKEALEVFKHECPEYDGEFFTINLYMRPEWMENS